MQDAVSRITSVQALLIKPQLEHLNGEIKRLIKEYQQRTVEIVSFEARLELQSRANVGIDLPDTSIKCAGRFL